MQYEEALKVWGAAKLGISPDEQIIIETNFDEGFSCCGGSDPLCYCSYATSPSAEIVIRGGLKTYRIDFDDFDFAEILGEIVKAANGRLEA